MPKEGKLCKHCTGNVLLIKVYPLIGTGAWVYQCPKCKMIDSDYGSREILWRKKL